MRGLKPELACDPGAVDTIALPPAWLSKHAKAEWRRVMPELVKRRILTPADFGVLARAVPGLRGVKVAHSGAEWCAQFLAEAPGLSLFVPGHELATGISHGAHGSYSNVACLSPRGAVRWNRPSPLRNAQPRLRTFRAGKRPAPPSNGLGWR